MFKDYTFPDWTSVLAVVSFVIVLGIFLAMLVKAVRMTKREAGRLSRLPLEDGGDTTDNRNEEP